MPDSGLAGRAVLRLLARLVEILGDDRVELRIGGLDAGDGGVDQLQRCDFLFANQGRLPDGVDAGKSILGEGESLPQQSGGEGSCQT